MEAIYQDYEADGFMVIEVLILNSFGEDPTLADLQTWANDFGIVDTEILADEGFRVYGVWNSTNSVPQVIIIGRDKVILYHDAGWSHNMDDPHDPGTVEGQVRAIIENALY